MDDSTLDKPYARSIELVTRHWSGKHHRVVWGINLISMVWTDDRAAIPCNFRVYDKPIGGKNKNGHFRDMLESASARLSAGVRSVRRLVQFSGESEADSLPRLGVAHPAQVQPTEPAPVKTRVNPDGSGNVPVSAVETGAEGRRVHLRGYGFIKVFRTVSPDGDAQHWATSGLEMPGSRLEELSQRGWSIENYHRGLKQCCGVEKEQARSARACPRPRRGGASEPYLLLDSSLRSSGGP